MLITQIKTLFSEPENYYLNRASIGDQYIFIQFLSPAKVYINGIELEAPIGSCILYNKFSHQEFFSDGVKLLHNWCHISGNLDETVTKYNFKYDQLYEIKNTPEITKIMQTLEMEFLRKSPYYTKVIELEFEKMLLKIMRYSSNKYTSAPIKKDLRDKFISLRNELCLKYNEDWNLEKMAAYVNLSTSRFCKLYTDIFQISPKRDIHILRIEHAKSMLRENKYSVEEVAELVGYKNVYNFIRRFHEYTGITPGKYK